MWIELMWEGEGGWQGEGGWEWGVMMMRGVVRGLGGMVWMERSGMVRGGGVKCEVGGERGGVGGDEGGGEG